MKDDPVVREISHLLIPLIWLFALYVQFHGDFGPGGGFQAGVIFAAGIILHAMVDGLDRTRRFMPERVLQILASFGVLLYAGIGVLAMLLGGRFLDYDVLHSNAHDGQHYGILAIELGVGVTVYACMVLLYYAFAGRGRADMTLEDVAGLYNYWVVMVLMMTGFYIVIQCPNLVKKLIGLNIFQTSVFILFITMGKVREGTAPIMEEGLPPEAYSNPLPHVLILTAIVVGVATTAVGLALVVRVQEAFGSCEADEILEQEGAV